MKKFSVAILVSAALGLAAPRAGGVPPPTSEAELEKRADTIVEAESAFVVCNGVTKQGTARLQQYLATMKPYKWHKGARSDSLTIQGAVAIDPLPPGPVPSPPLPRGWRGKLYLVKTAKNVYGLASNNAAIEDKPSSTPNDLPRCSESRDPAPALSTIDPDPPPPVDASMDAGAPEPAATTPTRGCGGCAMPSGRPPALEIALIFALAAGLGRRHRMRKTPV